MRFTPFHASDIRVLFLGTPEFAVPSLAALVEHAPPGRLWPGGLDVQGVLTRVDKPAGRGRQVVPSPVKRYALERELHVYQPGSLRKPETLALLQRLAPDLIVVAAFGQILPPEVLDLPPYGCLNVHASLLPRWRGASPIAAAILAGDEQTGVTIMEMDEGLDTGPVVAQRATPILPNETTGELTMRLAGLGAELLIETLPYWLARGLEPTPQEHANATTSGLIAKSAGRIEWGHPAEQIARQVRAYSPWPGAFTSWEGHPVKVLRALPLAERPDLPPGRCYPVNSGLAVACEQGALALEVIQLEGKRALPIADVLRGHPQLATATFGA